MVQTGNENEEIAFYSTGNNNLRYTQTFIGPMFEPSNRNHEKFMKNNGARMLLLLKFNICCIWVSGALWTIFPILNRIFGYNVVFTAYFPFDTDQSPIFELVVAYISSTTILIAYGTVAMDCTIVSLYAQARTQLQVLRYNLEHIGDSDEDISDGFQELRSRDGNLLGKKCNSLPHRRLVRCIKHHHLIIWYVNEVQSIFGEAMVVQFLVISWIICMTLYKLVAVNLLSAEFLFAAMYLVCMLVQLFIFCYCGTQLSEESALLNQSVYFSDWTSMLIEMRRELLLMMVCSKPMSPRIAYILPMSMETFIPILKFSYTLLTMLDRK